MSEHPTKPTVDGDINVLYILGQIDAKLTQLVSAHSALDDRLNQHGTRIGSVEDRLVVIDNRIDTLEQHRWKIIGIASAVPLLLSAATAFVALTGG